MFKRSALIGATALLLVACQPSAPVAPPFQPALDKHFNSIIKRDLESYKSTLTKGETLPLIFPDGAYMETRDAVEKFHKEWFSNPDWRMSFEEVNRIVGSDIASVLVRTAYQDTEETLPRFGYLTLTFQLQDGEWRLVHDQNTRISNPIAITGTNPAEAPVEETKEN